MNWLHPEWLWASWLVVPLALLVAVATWRHRRRVDAAFGAELAMRVLPRGTRRRRNFRDLLFVGGLLCMGLALAEPAFDKEIVRVETEGVDLVLAIDLSRSMDAEDVSPSRLERARREIGDLLDLVVGDRVAVVFFAGEAIGRLPLTQDYKAVRWVLGEADTRVFRAQGSAVGKAIDVAREMLSRDEGKAGKAMVIFSDGESHDPEEAMRAAREAASEGLVIYTVAIGEEASTIPDGQGGVVTWEGAQVKTVPDFATLEEVARITGGATVTSSPSARDMEELYRAGIRSKVRSAKRDTQQAENWRTAYQFPLGVGLSMWLLGAWLGDGRRRFGAAASMVLVASLLGGTAEAATSAYEADALYQAGDFRRAEKAFEELSLQTPDDGALFQRLGAARYRLGDFVGAATAWERASRLAGGDADALYNAGNARYRAGQLEGALASYERALGLEPGHAGASGNKAVVAGELAARRQEQPPPPPQPSEGGEDENEGGDGSEESPDPKPGDESDENDGDGEGEDQPADSESQDGSDEQGDQEQQDPSDGKGDKKGDQQGDSPPSDGEGVDPEELDGEEGDQQPQDAPESSEGSSEGGMGEPSGSITPAQASRMLDAVEEGRQRVQYVGREETKPW